jgi:hypothetical protein
MSNRPARGTFIAWSGKGGGGDDLGLLTEGFVGGALDDLDRAGGGLHPREGVVGWVVGAGVVAVLSADPLCPCTQRGG